MSSNIPHIETSRRLLAVAAPGSGVLKLLQDLTGSAVETPNGDGLTTTTTTTTTTTSTTTSTAGLLHSWDLTTTDYSTTVPIWIEEIADIGKWREAFVRPVAVKVAQVIGAWVYCFEAPTTQRELETIKNTLSALADVIYASYSYGYDDDWAGVVLAIKLPQSTTPELQLSYDDWDEMCAEHGFDYADSEATGHNKYNGLARVREMLEANEWSLEKCLDVGSGESDDDDDDYDDEEVDNFLNSLTAEEREKVMELAGMEMGDALRGEGSI